MKNTLKRSLPFILGFSALALASCNGQSVVSSLSSSGSGSSSSAASSQTSSSSKTSSSSSAGSSSVDHTQTQVNEYMDGLKKTSKSEVYPEFWTKPESGVLFL